LVRLRYLGHNLEVPEGEFVIGRSSRCQLSIDDPLISRQHAVLTVTNGRASLEDLSSRNGLLVNGKKIDGPTPLRDGDSITVGGQLMTIHGVEAPDVVRSRRSEMQTMQTATWLEAPTDDGADDTRISPSPMRSSAPDARVNELTLVGAVAEKALAMGRPEDAHRLLERPLKDLLARAPSSVDNALAQRAAALATRLASALNRSDWVDYVFELYTVRKELLPQAVVDELYTVLRRVRGGASSLVKYLETLRNASATFGPNDRFLISRIEGLEPLVGLK
jgi:predicted component of type VI protein secretion system